MRGALLLLPPLLLLAVPGFAQEVDRIAVVVHAERDVRLTEADLAQIYLKKRRFWSGGEPIVAVNCEARCATRRAFSRLVFGERSHRLAAYWHRQYFDGILPPATLASDEAIKRFVAQEPQAIGYIGAEAVDGTVRVILYLE